MLLWSCTVPDARKELLSYERWRQAVRVQQYCCSLGLMVTVLRACAREETREENALLYPGPASQLSVFSQVSG